MSLDPTRTRSVTAATAFFFLVAAVLLLFRPDSITGTWDERADVDIVHCLDASHDPFACTTDISQTRLPYYIHWAVESVFHRRLAHFATSAGFALANLALVFVFARRRFGPYEALLALAAMSTAPPLLASGRMLLTHSNVIFTTFTLLSVLAYDVFDEGGDRRFFWGSAVAFGLATGCSALGAFNGLLIAAYWIFGARRPRPAQAVGYVAVAIGVFFAATLVYLRPANLQALIAACLHGDFYDYWNYLGLGTYLAPRWYSLALFAIKIGPWWAALFFLAPLCLRSQTLGESARRSVLALWSAITTLLILKSAIFRYDAPHHQTPWYPFAYLLIAVVVVQGLARSRALLPIALLFLGVIGGLQIRDAVRFFPNYLFYGAQYGERFLGEFYGPAVLHFQDRGAVDAQIDALVAANPDVRILVADNNAFERTGANFVRFTERDRSARYDYALVDRLYATHLRFPERDRYNRFLAHRYTPVYTHEFPLHAWAYRILKAD